MSIEPSSNLQEQCEKLLNGADALAHRAVRTLRLRSLALGLAITLLAALVLAIVDYSARFDDVALRWLSSGLLVSVIAIVIWRIVVPACLFQINRSQLAQWIDARDQKKHELSTAIQLAELHQLESTTSSDSVERYGSSSFRQTALRDWFGSHELPNWTSYLDLRSLRLALMGLLLSATAWGVWAMLSPNGFRIAAWRLLAPFASAPWPFRDQLQLVDPPKVVAYGSSVQIEIIDLQLPPPSTISLLLRSKNEQGNLQDGGRRITTVPTRFAGDIAVASLPDLEDSIEIRAIGGDDTTMDWHAIDVIQPPNLETYEFEISPPEYSRQPRKTLTGSRIQVLAGSRVKIIGKFDSPVNSLSTDVQVAAAETEAYLPNWQAELSSNQRSFELTDQSEAPEIRSTLRIQLLADESGVPIPIEPQWWIECKQDAPPQVSVQSPRLSVVTPGARIRVQGSASDDWGLVSVQLLAQRSLGGNSTSPSNEADSESTTLPNSTANSDRNKSVNAGATSTSSPSSDVAETRIKPAFELELLATPEVSRSDTKEPQRTASVDELVSLGELAVQLGDELAIQIRATDTLGQTTLSTPVRIVVQDSSTVLGQLQSQQSDVLAEVRQLVQAQRTSQAAVARVNSKLLADGELRGDDERQLVDAAQLQASIVSRLSSENSGVAARLSDAITFLEQNQLGSSLAARQYSQLLAQVKSETQPTAEAAQQASRLALQAAESARSGGGKLSEQVEQLLLEQSASVRSLEKLQDQLARGESLSILGNDLADILSKQRSLKSSTTQLQLQSIALSQDATTAELARELTVDQQTLNRQLDEFYARGIEFMSNSDRKMGTDTAQLSEQETAPLRRALATLDESQVSTAMGNAAGRLNSRQFDNAVRVQEEAIQSLQRAVNELVGAGGSQAQNLANYAQNLQESAQQIAELARNQATLAEKANRLAEESEQPEKEQAIQLAAEQQALADAVEAAAQRASSQNQDAIGSSLAEAKNDQDKASSFLQQADQANLQNAGASSERAAEKLAATAEQAQRRASEARRAVRQQQALRLSEKLREISERQAELVSELQHIAESSDSSNRGEIRSWGISQTQLRQQTEQVRQQADTLPTFDWTLRESASDMERAVAAALRQRVAPDGIDAASEALAKLLMAAEALAFAEIDSAKETGEDPAPDANSENESKATPLPPIVSLKLLRALQVDLHRKTSELSSGGQTGSSTRLGELARQQRELAEQLEQLLRNEQTP